MDAADMAAGSREGRLAALDAAFRAANYLGAAQLYLRDNALLREALRPDHIKHRLLGHWGTQPGLNLLYAHLNRLVQDSDSRLLLVVGPGHGAPGVLASLFLEGTLTECYPEYPRDGAGLARFVRAFSWPGGFPSHLTAMTPGTLHEGGELGYSLLHAYGAVLDDPGLVAVCVVGDGEAETGALAASWHSHRFLDPRRDGAVLPVLHLNGYKLSGPAIFARLSDEELRSFFAGHGHAVEIVAGTEPMAVHAQLWDALDRAHAALRARQRAAEGPWPALVLRTPKGWTGPKTLDGKPIEGTFHSHQIPVEYPREKPEHLAALEAWLRSYGPEALFPDGRPEPAVLACVPRPERRLGRAPAANGGAAMRPLVLPDPAAVAVAVERPGQARTEATTVLGRWLRDVFRANEDHGNFRLFCPDETTSNRLEAVYEATSRAFDLPMVPTDEHLSRHGRVMEVLSEHLCQGWLEGYLLSGRHGVFACYEAFIGIVDSMMMQFAKWTKMAAEVPWRAETASLNYLLTSHVWEQDHNGYSHQGPGFINTLLMRKPAQVRVFLPPDANCLLAAMEGCLGSRGRINLVVASKKPQPQWLDLPAARAHLAAGAGTWRWAGTAGDEAPDVVLAAAGDVPTREAVAAAELLRGVMPGLATRVVNVANLMSLESREDHPDALDDRTFDALFTPAAPVVFAFHGYPNVVHELLYRRPAPERFHVHGYREEGTTTTPFDMLARNGMSRFDLAMAALRAVADRDGTAAVLRQLQAGLDDNRAYLMQHGEDRPDLSGWRFAASPGA